VVTGVRIAAGITLSLAIGVIFTQQRGFREQAEAAKGFENMSVREILARMPSALKRLLVAAFLVATRERSIRYAAPDSRRVSNENGRSPVIRHLISETPCNI
jgi:hypothetical protein